MPGVQASSSSKFSFKPKQKYHEFYPPAPNVFLATGIIIPVLKQTDYDASQCIHSAYLKATHQQRVDGWKRRVIRDSLDLRRFSWAELQEGEGVDDGECQCGEHSWRSQSACGEQPASSRRRGEKPGRHCDANRMIRYEVEDPALFFSTKTSFPASSPSRRTSVSSFCSGQSTSSVSSQHSSITSFNPSMDEKPAESEAEQSASPSMSSKASRNMSKRVAGAWKGFVTNFTDAFTVPDPMPGVDPLPMMRDTARRQLPEAFASLKQGEKRTRFLCPRRESTDALWPVFDERETNELQ
ncbi:unnamed protein product [Mycena citricolor]|uniref:Uncharacterized protein n=1 Tax=Mycena citricolor TaxID=2018698 RepID=A0AAD2GXF3_9AGAR|nr:unnamed protein product [Mycena citricolor]CAK5264460.1 unnamed protein product [Mycena citricolor]